MKYNIILVSTIFLALGISCTSAQKESKQTRLQQENQVQNAETAPVPSSSSPAIQSSPEVSSTLPDSPDEADAPALSGNAITTETASEIVLNPPHGQPGHSCDIPVGSPLNGATASNVREVTGTSFAPTVENAERLGSPRKRSTTAPASASSGNLNPPHGQPGHRCEIPVGSPLN